MKRQRLFIIPFIVCFFVILVLGMEVNRIRTDYVELSKRFDDMKSGVMDFAHEPDDPPRPEHLCLYHKEDRHYLLGVIDEIFPNGFESLSDESKSIQVIRFVTSQIEVGPVERYKTSAEYIKDQTASCGGFAMVFSDLVRIMGLPSTYLGVFGFSDVGGHALSEVYYDGSWHLYDATFGVIFYSRDTYDGKGEVLSAKKVLTARSWPTMMQVVSKPWMKNYHKERHYGVIQVGPKPTSHVYTYWNEKNRKTAFPVAYGDNSTVSFPIHVDLKNRWEFAVGTINQSWKDVYLETAKRPCVGYFYVGGRVPRSIHTIGIEVARRSTVEIVYVSKDDNPPPLSIFPLDSMHIIDIEHAKRKTTIKVVLSGPRGSGLVFCHDGLFWVDSLSIKKLK